MILDKIVFPSILQPNSPLADQEGYVTYSGMPILMNIQPESPVMTSMSEGEVFATFHFFTLFSGVQNGWRLTVSGSNPVDQYTVRGVERYTWGAGVHYEGTLMKAHQ